MNKVFGKITLYAPIRIQGKRTVVSYDFKEVGDGINATWNEIYFSQKVKVYPTLDEIKSSIFADINSKTDEKIVSGFIWNENPVWLSLENQSNFSTAEHRASTTGDNLPHKEKIGELEDGTAVYHTFETAAELTEFWNACQDHINTCRNEGWELKDSIDWSQYEMPTEEISE